MDIKKYIINSRKTCVIFDYDLYNSETDFLDEAALLMKSGADMIILSFKEKNDADTIKLGLKLRDLTSYYNAVFIVKKRADIAKILKADGIFLESFDMPIKNAIDVLDSDFLIGTGYNSDNADFMLLSDDESCTKNIPVFYLYSKKQRKERIFFDKKPNDDILSLINSI